jgi:Protein of unknown function (DUF1573)
VKTPDSTPSNSFAPFLLAGAVVGLVVFVAQPQWRLETESGGALQVVQPTIEVVAKPDETAHVVFHVRNTSQAPIRVVGVEADCGCIGLPELPIVIEPDEVAELTFHLATVGLREDATVEYLLQLFVDQAHPHLELHIRLVGSAVGKTS